MTFDKKMLWAYKNLVVAKISGEIFEWYAESYLEQGNYYVTGTVYTWDLYMYIHLLVP